MQISLTFILRLWCRKAAAVLGTFTLNTTAIDSADQVGWTFSVADSVINYLAAGQTLTQRYNVTVSDGRGGTNGDSDLTGTNDGVSITSGAQAASIIESLSGNGRASAPHTASGTVTYSDVDAADLHTTTVAPHGTSYLGTFTLNTANIDSADQVGWSFAVADKALRKLAPGETVQQLYDIVISDGHGGTATQTVTITLNGSDVSVSGGFNHNGAGSDYLREAANDPMSSSPVASGDLNQNFVLNTLVTLHGDFDRSNPLIRVGRATGWDQPAVRYCGRSWAAFV